jgi:hypothetical protein
MELTYSVHLVAGMPMAFVEFKLPIASATIGQNYIHAGLESIDLEIKCAALLSRLLLTTVGFNEGEVQSFMTAAEVELVELTWHTATRSPRAALNLQKRTRQVFEALQAVKSRHDVGVQHVEIRIRDGMPCLIAELKEGDEFRQYGKYHQVISKSRRGKKRFSASPEMAKRRGELLKQIENHIRNECRIERETLKKHHALSPKSWDEDVLKKAMNAVWDKAGLGGIRKPVTSTEEPELSPQAQATWGLYEVGESLKDVLPAYTITRHRKSILRVKGVDIACESRRNRIKPESVGRQLQYERRWKPNGEWRKLTLCEETAPAIIEDLERGLAYIKDGEIPEFQDDAAREAWLKRWRAYAEREWLCKPVQVAADSDKTPCVPRSRRCRTIRFARGIGNVPVNPNSVDELIYLDGESLVI